MTINFPFQVQLSVEIKRLPSQISERKQLSDSGCSQADYAERLFARLRRDNNCPSSSWLLSYQASDLQGQTKQSPLKY